MKIEATTTTPAEMVAAIDKAMADDSLKTWKSVKTNQGEILYTHTPGQWNERALIERHANPGLVVFTITFWKSKTQPTKDEEGYYFGRFTEVLLVHFRNYFSKLVVSV